MQRAVRCLAVSCLITSLAVLVVLVAVFVALEARRVALPGIARLRATFAFCGVRFLVAIRRRYCDSLASSKASPSSCNSLSAISLRAFGRMSVSSSCT